MSALTERDRHVARLALEACALLTISEANDAIDEWLARDGAEVFANLPPAPTLHGDDGMANGCLAMIREDLEAFGVDMSQTPPMMYNDAIRHALSLAYAKGKAERPTLLTTGGDAVPAELWVLAYPNGALTAWRDDHAAQVRCLRLPRHNRPTMHRYVLAGAR